MSEYGEMMKQIVQTVHPDLRLAGFRKRRHTFNRETERGLIQVVNFQMGPYEPGNSAEFPPIRVNLYGKFTVNLGIFLEEVHRHLSGLRVSDFISEYQCDLRKRLPELLPVDKRPVTEKGVGWWSLDDASLKTANEMRWLFADYVLPFFERLSTRDGILEEWRESGPELGLSPGPLAIAIIYFHRGDVAAAERLIRDYVAAGFKNPGHREFVEKIAASMNIETS